MIRRHAELATRAVLLATVRTRPLVAVEQVGRSRFASYVTATGDRLTVQLANNVIPAVWVRPWAGGEWYRVGGWLLYRKINRMLPEETT